MISRYLSKILLIIGSAILFYVFFRSEIIHNGQLREHYFSYYIISFFLLIFSVLTFFLSDKLKEYLGITLFSALISLYFFELYQNHRNLDGQPIVYIKKIISPKKFKNFDLRNVKQVVKDLRKANPNVYTVGISSELLINGQNIKPLSGLSNSLLINCNENGYFSSFNSDRHGFNNPDGVWDQKNFEFILLGDSFIEGQCVNNEFNIDSEFRKINSNQTLNLGYGGHGPLRNYAKLKEYLDNDQIKIKNILWFYYEGNDLSDLTYEKHNKILKKYLNDNSFKQNLEKYRNQIDNNIKVNIEKHFVQYNFFSILKLYSTRSFFKNIFEYQTQKTLLTDEIFDNYKEVLQKVQNFAKKKNSKLYFIYLPRFKRYDQTQYKHSVFGDKEYNNIKNMTNELNISFIDIDKLVFNKLNNKKSLFPFEGLHPLNHYNEKGYKMISKAVLEYIN